MPQPKDRVEEQLKSLGDFYQFFTAKELRFLPEILTENERIHGVTSGYYESKTWIIIITNTRLIFLDKGMLYGLKQVDLPLSQISAVSHKTGLFFGEIVVSTSAGPNTIGSIAKREARKICAILSGLIHERGGGSRSGAFPQGNDLASQLEKLSILKEKGALTEEEFQVSKSKLLR